MSTQRSTTQAPAPDATHRAKILAWGDDGYPVIRLATAPSAVMSAELATSVTDADIDGAIAQASDAVVIYAEDSTQRPVILAVLRGPRGTQSVQDQRFTVVDDAGRTVVDAEQELVLRCGDAMLSLRADGKIKIRGLDVITRARRTHRITGGVVLIN